MLKRIFLLLILVTIVTFPASTVNKVYKALSETTLWDKNEGGKREIAIIEKGDSVYTTAETERFFQENEGGQIHYFPVEYKGKKGFVSKSQIYPVKANAEDTLTYMQTKYVKERVAQEKFLVPEMEWAMNLPVSHMGWIYVVLASLVCAGLSACTTTKKTMFYPGLALTGIFLTLTSGAEIMYLLCFHDHVLWFVQPSVVGGWGHVILNFILLSMVFAAQGGLFYFMWKQSFNSFLDIEEKVRKDHDDEDEEEEDDDKTPSWLGKLAFWPFGLGLVLMILIWVDYFQEGTMSADVYIWAFATLALCALCGMGYQLSKKRFLQGLVYPVLYITSGIGLACGVMILGMLMVLVIIVGAIFLAIALMALSAAAGALFGRERVTGYTDDGRKVTGTKDMYGNVKGDDGNTYTIK